VNHHRSSQSLLSSDCQCVFAVIHRVTMIQWNSLLLDTNCFPSYLASQRIGHVRLYAVLDVGLERDCGAESR
jgi:hypothetical protein